MLKSDTCQVGYSLQNWPMHHLKFRNYDILHIPVYIHICVLFFQKSYIYNVYMQSSLLEADIAPITGNNTFLKLMLNNNKQPSKLDHFSDEKVRRRRAFRTDLRTTKDDNIPCRISSHVEGNVANPFCWTWPSEIRLLPGIFYSKSMDHVFALYVNTSKLDNLLLGTVVALLSWLSTISTKIVCCIVVYIYAHHLLGLSIRFRNKYIHFSLSRNNL